MRTSSRQQRERVRHCRIDGEACTLTIPTNTALAFPVRTRIDLPEHGAGQVTISDSGVIFRSSRSKLKLAGQYSGATLWKRGTNEWLLTLTAQRDAARQELAAALVTASKLVDPAPPEPEAGEAEPVAGES